MGKETLLLAPLKKWEVETGRLSQITLWGLWCTRMSGGWVSWSLPPEGAVAGVASSGPSGEESVGVTGVLGGADIWGDPPVASQFSLCSSLVPDLGPSPRSARVIKWQSKEVTVSRKAL